MSERELTEQEMMERYIYDVVRRVPQDSREEIRMELQGLIEDMSTELRSSVELESSAQAENSIMEQVLQKLGDPAEFAKRFRDHGNYLIGPDYYDHYFWVMKIALFAVGISALVSAVVLGITKSNDVINFFVSFFGEFFSTLINGAFSVMGIVTLIFAVMEYQKVKIQKGPEKKWSVEELSKNKASVNTWTPGLLPAIPDKRAVISRGDSVFSIIFIIVLSALLLFTPQIFGAFHYENGQLISIACIFNLEEWRRIMPLFLFTLFVGLIEEIIRLVIGYYCKPVMYISGICNTLQIIFAVLLLKCLPLWNPHFAEEVMASTGIQAFSRGDILNYWGTDFFSNLILIIICLISLLEIAVAVYKSLKYSGDN